MPCDPGAVKIRLNPKSNEVFLALDGDIVHADRAGVMDAQETAFVPHWATCDHPEAFRK